MSKTIKYMRLSIIISSKYCNHLSMIKREYVCSLVWPGLFVVDVLRSICVDFFLSSFSSFSCVCVCVILHSICFNRTRICQRIPCVVSVRAPAIDRSDGLLARAMKLFVGLSKPVLAHTQPTVHVSFQRHIEMGNWLQWRRSMPKCTIISGRSLPHRCICIAYLLWKFAGFCFWNNFRSRHRQPKRAIS